MQNLGDSLIYYLSQELTNFNMYNACYNIFISANGLDKYTINVFDSSNNFNYGNITSEYHSNLLCASLIRKKLSMRENVFLLMLKWIEDNKLLNNTINLSTNNTIKENSYRNTNNIDNNYKIINSKKHKLDINKHNSNKHILAVRDNWYNSRDNISLELRKKINCKYESVYLCEQTIITIHPVNNKLFNVYLRNPIANISFSIDLSMENSINQLTHDDCLNELLEDIEVNNIDDNIIDNNSNNSTNKHINLINENLNDEENINIQYISKHIKRNSNSYNTCFASIEKLDSKLNNNNNNNNDNNIVLNSKNYLKSVHKKRHSVEIKSNKSNLNSDLNSNKNNILQYNNYLIGNIVFKRVMSNLTEVNKENVIFTEVTNDKNIVELVSSIDHTPVYYTIEASVLYYQNKSYSLSEKEIICYKGSVNKEYLLFLSKLGKTVNYKDISFNQMYTNTNEYCFNSSCNRKVVLYQDLLYQLIYNVSHLINPFKKTDIEDINELYLSRKKIIGNSQLIIIFQQDNIKDYNEELIKSSVIMIYLIIRPINYNNFYLVEIKNNPMSKYNIYNRLLKWFEKETIIYKDCLTNYIRNISILLIMSIKYFLQKEDLIVLNKNNFNNEKNNIHNTNVDKALYSLDQNYFTNNIYHRYKEIQKICLNYKHN